MNKKLVYNLLLIATIVFFIGAVLSVIPMSSAPKECLVGYKAYCTFTPISTILLLMIAGGICLVREKKFKVEK